MRKYTNKIKKVSYGLSSKPLESLYDNVISDGTLDYMDPEYVDTEGVGDPDEIGGVMKTEPVMNPNKNRESEILSIMANYNIGPESLIKKANLDLISLGAVVGSRVGFNIISRARGYEFGNDQFVNFETANIASFINELKTKYDAVFNDASLSNLDAKARELFDVKKFASLGTREPANFQNPHLLLYSFKTVEDEKNKGIFSCDPNNHIMSGILQIKTQIATDIADFEQFLLDNEVELLGAVTAGGAVGAGAQRTLLLSIPRNTIARLLRLIPGVETPEDILKLLIGFKTLNESYEYALEKDMCNNISKYTVKGDRIEASVGNALYLLQKSIMGNLRDVFRSIGSFAKDFKDAVTLGVEDFKNQMAPPAGRLSYQVMEEIDSDYKTEVNIPSLSDNKTKFYTLDKTNVLDDSAVSGNLFEGSIPNMFGYGAVSITPISNNLDDRTLEYLIKKVIGDSKSESIGYETSDFYGSSIGQISGLKGLQTYCTGGAQATIEGVIREDARETTEFTGSGYSYDYTAVKDIGVFDASSSQSLSALRSGDIIIGFESNTFLFMASILHVNSDKVVFKEIYSLVESDLNDPGSLKMVLDEKTFKHDVAVLARQVEISDGQLDEGVIAAHYMTDFPDAGKTCVKSIDYATAYSALRHYVLSKNLISEKRLEKKINKSIKSEEKSQRKDDRRSRRRQWMKDTLTGD